MLLHITGGALAIASGYAALFARKGGRAHRRAGVLFVFSMLAMGAGALVIGLARDAATWAGGPLVAYLVISATTTVRRSGRSTPWLDRALTATAVVLAAVFFVMGVGAVRSPGTQLEGVPAAAFFLNGTVALLAFRGDVRVLRDGPPSGNRRLARHLWRMCFAMFIATGSFFLGQAQVIPRPLRVPPVLMVLALLPLAFLFYWFYWMWRVRRRRDPSGSSKPLAPAARTAATAVAVFWLAPLGLTVGAQGAGPSDAVSSFSLGRSKLLEGDHDAAIRNLERASALDGANAEYRYWLGRALYEAAPHASKIRVPGMARRVRLEWERAVALDPNHVEARAGLAEWYAMAPGFMGGSGAKAREQAAEVTTRNAMRGALVRGAIARHERDWVAEECAYQEAISLAPDTMGPYVTLADAYARTDRVDAAFATIARYASRRPDDPWILYQTGRLAGSTGRESERGAKALAEFLTAPPPDVTPPALSRVHYWYARIAERQGDRELARQRYEKALYANPNNRLAKRALEGLR